MECEISKVIELTGAKKEQIQLHNDGHWSRAYVVNGGEYVVKFPKPHNTDYDYKNEAKFLTIIRDLTSPINTQKLKWLAPDNRCIALYGVKGTSLFELGNITNAQKKSIGEQIGAFLKQLHSVKADFSGQCLEEELLEYENAYKDCADFFEKHFSKKERYVLDYLMYHHLPKLRRELGENLVFCHADIFEPNILLDDKGRVGIIDCSNAGYYDEAADFSTMDDTLRGFTLDSYGASEVLRKKVEIKYDMSIINCPKFGVPLWGESVIIEKWNPLTREVISKYENQIS